MSVALANAVTPPAHQPSILVVEDDEDLSGLLQELFVQMGWNVRLERNGAGALLALQRERPDVLVTDCMMPQMSGPEMLERIRHMPGLANLPVVLMSGSDSMLEGTARPRQVTLRKPFDPDKLINLVRKVLDSPP